MDLLIPGKLRASQRWGDVVRVDGGLVAGAQVAAVQVDLPPEYQRDWTLHLGAPRLPSGQDEIFFRAGAVPLLVEVQHGGGIPGARQRWFGSYPSRGSAWGMRGAQVTVWIRRLAGPGLGDNAGSGVLLPIELIEAPGSLVDRNEDHPRVMVDLGDAPGVGVVLSAGLSPPKAVAVRVMYSADAGAQVTAGSVNVFGDDAAGRRYRLGQYTSTLTPIGGEYGETNSGWIPIPSHVDTIVLVGVTAAAPVGADVNLEYMIRP